MSTPEIISSNVVHSPEKQIEFHTDLSKVPEGMTIRVHVVDAEGKRHEAHAVVYERWQSLGWKVAEDVATNTPTALHVQVDPLCYKRWDWAYPITVNYELVESHGAAQHADA